MSLYQQHPDPDAGENPPFNTPDTTARRSSGSGAIVWGVLALLAVIIVLWALFSFVL